MSVLKHLCAAIAAFLLCVPAYADLITFSSRTNFNSAAPGLPIETFETGLVAAGTITPCAGPLSSSAASTCFPLGGLLSGAVYSASPVGDMIVLGAGFDGDGNTSKVLGPNFFFDTLDITFTAGVAAAGLDVFPGQAAGNIFITLFSPAGAELNTFNVFGNIGPNFFGVVSTSGLIGRINIDSPAQGELIDNLAFGVPVPEPSSLLLSVGGLTIIAGLRFFRKRGDRDRQAQAIGHF
jgi:hypothetical protein